MSDKLPFEDEFKRKMSDLPAGNEDVSWNKMKALLDKKDKRKPFAWAFYLILIGLFITGLISTWMLLSHEKKNSKDFSVIKHKRKDSLRYNNTYGNETTQSLSHFHLKNTKKLLPVKTLSNEDDTNNLKMTGSLRKINPDKFNSNFQYMHQNNEQPVNSVVLNKRRIKKHTDKKLAAEIISGNVSEDSTMNKSLQNDTSYADNTPLHIADSTTDIQQPGILNDTITKNKSSIKTALKIDTSTVAKHNTSIVKKQKHYTAEAGIQFVQSLPFDGQRITAYNYDGNKNPFYDYVPSVFIKLGNKYWFFQTEFSYASPQLIRPFAYTRVTSANYSSGTVTTTLDNLQKVYYTQLPLSFNYYMFPNLYVGIGVSLNWFHGAVTQHKVVLNDLKTDSEIVRTNVVPLKAFNDSFFYRSQSALLFQAGYTIKKWSFSLRYTKGLQSFVTFIRPDGTVSNKKNTTLQLLVGYSLFSKRLNYKKPFDK